ncbi:hypothetical protein B7P33_05030 [Sediminicola luteus]|uniref:Uncharacterized protein n=1 Tax=Sediminicola luteus TaxID=319238 RepID=A0A2A4GE15_9FLAO|nr:hypothetical protein B7P33_05030 [Sediminicola luteus]
MVFSCLENLHKTVGSFSFLVYQGKGQTRYAIALIDKNGFLPISHDSLPWPGKAVEKGVGSKQKGPESGAF